MLKVEILDPAVSKYKKETQRLAAKLLKKFCPGRFYLEIYLVGDAFMTKNVLSFPADKTFPRPDLKGSKALGEIYLNPIYIKRKQENFEHMVIHGFLHLLGYDHVKKRDRIIMERLEQQLLSDFS